MTLHRSYIITKVSECRIRVDILINKAQLFKWILLWQKDQVEIFLQK